MCPKDHSRRPPSAGLCRPEPCRREEIAVGNPTAARRALLEAADMDKYAAAYLEIAPGSVKVGSSRF
jgi:hypothetical protein